MKKIELLCMVLVLISAGAGCEDKLNKLHEVAKPTEPTQPTKSLHEAAADGNINQVKLLISKGADVNAKDEKENTPLRYAVRAGKMEVVRLLIEAGADVNAGSWPPLRAAVDEDNIAIAEYLIAHGANVNSKGNYEWTPLQQAPYSSSMEMIKMLIAKGADVNAGPWTALHSAVQKGRRDIAELLIQKGADVNAKQKGGYAPLYYAISNKDLGMVNVLITKGADVNAGPHPALHSAAQRGHSDIAELLIQKGASVNAKDKRGYPPLYYAISKKHLDTAKLLIAHGADVNAKDKRGYPPLYYAISKKRLDTAKLLIAHGANVNTKDKQGLTTLHSVALVGRKDMAELLLAHGADVNAKDNRDRTPLHLVLDVDRFIYRLFKDMAELLIAKGTDVSSKDNYGRSPLHLAAESAQKDIIELLLAKGAKVDEKDDEYGFTALHYAARFGNKNVAEFLVAKGADINAKDKEGHTPLYTAICHDYKVAEVLINKGADGNIKTESGQTLLQLAQERKKIESAVPDKVFDGEVSSKFGVAIACGDVDGDGYDDILIGGQNYNNDRGRVYLHYGGPDMDTTSDLIFEAETEGDFFGCSVSCGDIDDDGYEDIVIGAYLESAAGRAYLYWGKERSRMDADPDKIFDGEARERAFFSYSVNGPAIYDIDNDGYRDIIFGAYGTGRAYLYYGNTKELMDTSHDLTFTAGNNKDNFGFAIGCGDVDNDGYGDIIVGARLYPGRGLGRDAVGRAYLYYGGNRSNMDAKADEIFDAESKDTHYFGQGIACIDQNKDGYDDIIIGAQGYKGRQGRAYLFYGGTRANLDTVPDKTFDGEIEWGDYGFVILCGDIDGDNNNDIIIGADHIRQQVGRVYVYWGSELSGPSSKTGRILTGENPGEWFSQMMACGDVNNDGYDDLIIGARGYKAGSNQGRAYLYYGGPRNR